MDVSVRRANLERLLRPASVAVIGASGDPARIGGRPVRYLKEAGFAGPIYPVNPGRDQVQGLKSYASIRDIGEPVDAVVVAIPAAQAIEAVKDCAAAGVGGCILFSADFAEAGPEGVARQEALTQISRESGMRILGPNCLGLFNAPTGAFLTFSSFFDRGVSKGGQTALISQSGGFGSHLLEVVKERGCQIGTWITTGNEADVELGECVEWAARQDGIDTILAYTEGVKDGVALRRGLVAAHGAGKPVVFMKAGRSARGVEAASTHTAALAGSDAMYRGIFKQFGVRRVYSAEEMADVAYVLQAGKMPLNRSAVIFTISGAGGVQMSDSADDVGLDIPVLPDGAQAKIKALASYAAPGNPVDFTAQALNDPAILPGCLDAVAKHTDIGSFLVYLTMTADDPQQREPIFDTLTRFSRRYPDKLFVLCMLGSADLTARYEAAGWRVFSDSARAVMALGRAVSETGCAGIVQNGAPLTRAALEKAASSEEGGKHLLATLGIDVPRGAVVDAAQEAAEAVGEWNFPVVAKIVSQRILHKSDIGGVRLNLHGPDAVRTACEEILTSVRTAMPDLSGETLLVEEQVGGAEAELILGIENDAVLGSMVMIGMGGVQAEILQDAVFRMAPVDVDEAQRMLDDLQAVAIFAPFRGRPALARDAVARAISTLSQFAAANADTVQSIDVNPLLVGIENAGRGAVAADCVILLKDISVREANE
ncbi:acetate--CoA ligase family protein [Pseudophaeobacter sp.]|jgi:acyl-CoA synthetase (NDP forming)|uniref:acetate--CoA ligase family protein n=1 Tax=Pseudophaeobacter sp. TaxID=1971739 RepID=UPI0032D90790